MDIMLYIGKCLGSEEAIEIVESSGLEFRVINLKDKNYSEFVKLTGAPDSVPALFVMSQNKFFYGQFYIEKGLEKYKSVLEEEKEMIKKSEADKIPKEVKNELMRY